MLYRVRRMLNVSYFNSLTKDIWRTLPVRSDPNATCEVHTMLCHADIQPYLVAIKSLLWHAVPLQVVIHSDGSLSAPDIRTLTDHVNGATVVHHGEADTVARETLGRDSILFRWRGIDASWRRIVDTALWTRARSRIIMDSDVLTVGPPQELTQWVVNGTRPFLLGQPAAGDGQAPPIGAHVQSVFRRHLDDISRKLDVPARFLQGGTGGFYGCRNELALDRVERLIGAATESGVPLEQWGGEQCAVIFLLSTAGAEFLGSDHNFNFDPSHDPSLEHAAIVHFFGTHRYYRGRYPRLARKVIRDFLSP